MMEGSSQRWRNSLWLIFLILQATAIILVDAVVFYPKWLYSYPSSPLYILQQLKDYYIATYNDPLVQAATEPHWMPLLLLIELVLQLPASVYGAYRLWKGRGDGNGEGTTGRLELLLLVHSFETALSTAICINDIFYWDEGMYPWEVKRVFLVQMYGPFLVIPALMFVDMYWRLFQRFSRSEAPAKKLQ